VILDDAKVCDRCGQPATDTREGVDLCGACFARKVMQEIDALEARRAALTRELKRAEKRADAKPKAPAVCAFCGWGEGDHEDWDRRVIVRGQLFAGQCYAAVAQGLVSLSKPAKPGKKKPLRVRELEERICELGLAAPPDPVG
jgi:ribosomal protein L37E